jgi:hypothetical protein
MQDGTAQEINLKNVKKMTEMIGRTYFTLSLRYANASHHQRIRALPFTKGAANLCPFDLKAEFLIQLNCRFIVGIYAELKT